MSSPGKGAPQYVEKSDGDLHLEPGHDGPGLRDWFHGLPASAVRSAAFDTRVDVSPVLGGAGVEGHRVAPEEARLHRRPAAGEASLVDKQNHLLPGEHERALAWGATLAAAVVVVA